MYIKLMQVIILIGIEIIQLLNISSLYTKMHQFCVSHLFVFFKINNNIQYHPPHSEEGYPSGLPP